MRTSISQLSFNLFLGLAAVVVGSAVTARAALIVDPLSASYAPTDTGTGANGLLANGDLSTPLATPGTTVTYTPGSMPTDTKAGIDFRENDKTNGLLNPIYFKLNTTPGTGGSASGYNIQGIYLYNYNFDFQSQRGFYQTDLKYSTDGTAYTDFGTVTFSAANGTTSDPGAFVSLGTTLNNVTNIEFANITDFDAQTPPVGGNGDYTGAEQVRFVATPEPASIALLGLGAIGILARRRRTA